MKLVIEGKDGSSHLVAAVEDSSQGVVASLARLRIDPHHHSTQLKGGKVTQETTRGFIGQEECMQSAIAAIIICWVFYQAPAGFFSTVCQRPFCLPALETPWLPSPPQGHT